MSTRGKPLPLAPRDIARSGLCIGCGSCVAQADMAGADTPGPRMDLDRYGHLKPVGPAAALRRRSRTFSRTCPFSPDAANEDELAADLFPEAAQHDPALGRFQTAYVGYVADQDFRERGSSGGMVSWVLAELLRKGLIDGAAHVVETADPQREERYFRYRISRTDEEIRAGAKSRYYPVELSEVIRTIRSVPGRYAVVGVPCFIKAVQLLRREDPVIRERVAFTLGLFCGHMKSARFVESFAWQMDVPVEEIQRVEFRHKDPDRPASWYNARLTLRDGRVVHKDWWHLADGDWGAGFFMNSACNYCDDVVGETADISFGDAWVEPYSSDGRGTNVVVIRSPVVEDLVAAAIGEGRLKLDPVDSAFVEQTQAAGFRQRREGLAYRLSWPQGGWPQGGWPQGGWPQGGWPQGGWPRRGVRPRKRVAPDARTPTRRRKLIYRMRSLITAWSHRVFWLARRTRRPAIYVRWARASLTVYHGLAYSRGRLGELIKRWGLREDL